MGQMMFSKYIVVVDDDCDVQNTSEVLFRLCANTDPKRDSTIITNPSDSLDHAPSVQNVGSHMGFDATRKLPGEGYHRGWPELIRLARSAHDCRSGAYRRSSVRRVICTHVSPTQTGVFRRRIAPVGARERLVIAANTRYYKGVLVACAGMSAGAFLGARTETSTTRIGLYLSGIVLAIAVVLAVLRLRMAKFPQQDFVLCREAPAKRHHCES